MTLAIAAIALLLFGGILVSLALTRNPSAQDAVTDEVVTKALTGPVPVPDAHARLTGPNRQPEAADPEPEDEAA